MHRALHGGVLKIAPPNFSFIFSLYFCKLKDFFKKWNAHNFFIFKARLLIFWVISHLIDLVTWYECHDDRTRLSPVLGCGSLRPPHDIITVKYPMTDRVKWKGGGIWNFSTFFGGQIKIWIFLLLQWNYSLLLICLFPGSNSSCPDLVIISSRPSNDMTTRKSIKQSKYNIAFKVKIVYINVQTSFWPKL